MTSLQVYGLVSPVIALAAGWVLAFWSHRQAVRSLRSEERPGAAE